MRPNPLPVFAFAVVLFAAGLHAADSDLLDSVEKPYRSALDVMKGVFAPDAKEPARKLKEAVRLREEAQDSLSAYLAKRPEKGQSLAPLRGEIRDALLWARQFSGDPAAKSGPSAEQGDRPGAYSAAEEGEELFWLVETYEKDQLKETGLIVRRYIDIAAKHPQTEFGRHAMRRAAQLMERAAADLELLETGSALLKAMKDRGRPPSRPVLAERAASELAKKLSGLAGDVRALAGYQSTRAEMEIRIRYGQKRIDQLTEIIKSQGSKMGIEQYRKYEKDQTDWMNAVPDAKKQSEEAALKGGETRRRIDKGMEEILAMGPTAIPVVQETLREASRSDLARPFLENLLAQLARIERGIDAPPAAASGSPNER